MNSLAQTSVLAPDLEWDALLASSAHSAQRIPETQLAHLDEVLSSPPAEWWAGLDYSKKAPKKACEAREADEARERIRTWATTLAYPESSKPLSKEAREALEALDRPRVRAAIKKTQKAETQRTQTLWEHLPTAGARAQARGGEAPGLLISEIMRSQDWSEPLFDSDLTWLNRREQRHRLRAISRVLVGRSQRAGGSQPRGVAKCGWVIGSHASIVQSEDGRKHWENVETCKSVWACPVCSGRRRMEYGKRIESLARPVFTGEKGGIFMTLTLRHRKSDPLALTHDVAVEGWRTITASTAWKRAKTGIRARYGVENYIRVVEHTYSQANGWHPHLHLLLSTSKPLSDAELSSFKSEIYGLWAKYSESRLDRKPSRSRGVDVRRVVANGDASALSEYLAKVTAGFTPAVKSETQVGVVQEMTRGDLKTARKKSYTPFELLDIGVGDLSESERRDLWLEFVNATRGRRFLTSSRDWSISASEVEDEIQRDFEGGSEDDEFRALESDEELSTAYFWKVARGDYIERLKAVPAVLLAVLLWEPTDAEGLHDYLEFLESNLPGEPGEQFGVLPPD